MATNLFLRAVAPPSPDLCFSIRNRRIWSHLPLSGPRNYSSRYSLNPPFSRNCTHISHPKRGLDSFKPFILKALSLHFELILKLVTICDLIFQKHLRIGRLC
ncbi:uncharacterized protein LOC143882092 [Tasmannia lanceolata]|uniref:uncharacterized protein LOC143882092 n=1 Tax=Tasmannia lanceolata TaxID=3420 RepID=UPI0040630163